MGDNIEDLNYIVSEENPKPVTIKAKLRNILMQHQEISE